MTDDKILRCSECGTNFLWTAEDQAAYAPPPAHCPMCQRLAPPAGQRRGTIKWFNRSKGFGFITGTDGSEVFVHKSGLMEGQSLPRTGQLVQFKLVTGTRGVQAADVQILELPQAAS